MSRWIRRTGLVMGLCLLIAGGAMAQAINGNVIDMWQTLNLRSEPSSGAAVVAELTGNTPLIVNGRTRSNRWYSVQTQDGASGWVAAGYVDLQGDRAALPIITELGAQSAAPAAPAAAPQAAQPAPDAAASIPTDDSGVVTPPLLNMRAGASLDAAVLTRLRAGTPVRVIGRTGDGSWLNVQTSRGEGWVAAQYIDLSVNVTVNPASGAASASINQGVVSIGANTRAIYLRGRELGNRRNVFSKVGDSISVDPVMYTPFAGDDYNLGDYSGLQRTVNYFKGSFGVSSLAAFPGWATTTLLNPQFAPTGCEAGETPLACEYRVRRPSIALIMIGSNDVAYMPPAEYAGYLNLIVDYTVNQGIIPVLSTIPQREGFEGSVAAFNDLIRATANNYGVPLVDYHLAMAGLPNAGISGDGLHPSIAPGGPANSATFNGQLLQFGYTMRNLVQLQALDVIRRNIF